LFFAKLQTISLRKVELEQCLMALLGTTPASNYPNGPHNGSSKSRPQL